MLKKILISNRGEIACRIVRTAKKLGVATVAVYSDADAKAMHVAAADEAVHIGPSPAPESYLRGDKIIAAARATGAEAIHPGYGFLSENADFADAVTKAGLKFIGPSASAMRALGGKAAAKEIAIKAGVPVVPGYQGEKQDAASLTQEARHIGFPVMIKAVAGGGGRGMRLVEKEADLAELLASAKREAESAFGDGRVLIEKAVERPRHIEVQVFGDAHGNVVHLFERDCTLQRRNQKVVEEAPAPGMTPELREKMCAAAVKLAKSVGYEGAGTVEFLVEGGSLGPDARWYFIEMNTRLQVEHPVTEEITGLDLVEWQLRVASGEKLPLAQNAIKMTGHAIEVRLCAEDPARGFLPSVGRIERFTPPKSGGSIRKEFGVQSGDAVSPFYDSMIGKIIAKGPDRESARERLLDAIHDTRLLGLKTNARFLRELLRHPTTIAATMDTGLIGRELSAIVARHTSENQSRRDQALAYAITVLLLSPKSGDPNWRYPPWSRPETVGWNSMDGFQLGDCRKSTRRIVIDGDETIVSISWADKFDPTMSIAGRPPVVVPDCLTASEGLGLERGPSDHHYYFLTLQQDHFEISLPTYDSTIPDDAGGDALRAPINGRVAKLFVSEGDAVEKGARIAVVEAMKMEHILHATRDGSIAKVAVKEGAQVNQGALIAALAEVKT